MLVPSIESELFSAARASCQAFEYPTPSPTVHPGTGALTKMMSSTATVNGEKKFAMRTVVAASAIGTTIEWYDFLIYSTAASLVLNKLFFQTNDPLIGRLLAIGTIGVGFFVRPLGAVVLSHFGDRVGRKPMLILTLVTMGVGTTLIGLLPTYKTIGVAAPILLATCRLAQGIAVGGEWGGAVFLRPMNTPKSPAWPRTCPMRTTQAMPTIVPNPNVNSCSEPSSDLSPGEFTRGAARSAWLHRARTPISRQSLLSEAVSR